MNMDVNDAGGEIFKNWLWKKKDEEEKSQWSTDWVRTDVLFSSFTSFLFGPGQKLHWVNVEFNTNVHHSSFYISSVSSTLSLRVCVQDHPPLTDLLSYQGCFHPLTSCCLNQSLCFSACDSSLTCFCLFCFLWNDCLGIKDRTGSPYMDNVEAVIMLMIKCPHEQVTIISLLVSCFIDFFFFTDVNGVYSLWQTWSVCFLPHETVSKFILKMSEISVSTCLLKSPAPLPLSVHVTAPICQVVEQQETTHIVLNVHNNNLLQLEVRAAPLPQSDRWWSVWCVTDGWMSHVLIHHQLQVEKKPR